MSDNIEVVVKVRPLIPRELEDKLTFQWRVKNNTLYQLDQNGRDFGPSFTFDQVYDTATKTCDIYNDIAKPIVKAATAGINGTIFAYGQTSSGKTYLMTGTDQSPGIIPLAVCNLFEIIKNIPDRDFLVRVSYIEIYNETVKDLLTLDKKKVKVHESFQGVKLDCTEQVTTSPEEVMKFLKEGEANRQTGATNMNEESSRSHSIFQITIESREHIEGEAEVGCVNVSQLNLVDLAGSERAGQTGATGLTFKEGTHINKSLSSLALVIKQLSEDQNRHVNYRDSKLTRILQNSLGGNAKTSIICAITPAAVEETISTLQFANRAKAIKNKPEVNAVATDATMIQSLTKQLSKLQSQLESKKNLEVMLESKKHVEHNLQKQIAALQRLILNGFGQRSSIDMMAGNRRKPVPPRRITISTLHPIDEDPVPLVPKFHTPLLKYNPATLNLPGPSPNTDFVPIQNANKLSTLSEETDNRLITPPPHDKKVNFDNEIIELDSDDDNSTQEVQTCSPHHKCYGSSKTPPCVLRKNAKLAETSLKDFVEHTGREKMYTPTVVELIEKLEENASVITRLQDELQLLSSKSKEKDLEIGLLKVKVSKSNEEIKTVNSLKAELEALCQQYTTKITDWEVSFETLKAKSKRREDELLSLLEEQKRHKKQDDGSKLLSRNVEKELNFMDMSKDISLVNSDNESSITNLTTNDDETASQVQDLVKDMQNQISSKNQSVLQLEAELLSQTQKIISLEKSSEELQKSVELFKEKVELLENENELLKTTVDNLNSTIKSQKDTIKSAHNDIESYNSVIQELQIKLTNKDKILNSNVTESYLEKMLANEEKFIANNENMKNIIHSFKLALDTRNKEIESLKSSVSKNLVSMESHASLLEKLKQKETEIDKLNENAARLQIQINENIALIDNLMKEKSNLSTIEQQLTSKLSDITKQNNQFEKDNRDLKESYDKLLSTLSDRGEAESELESKCKVLESNIEELNPKIIDLQKEVKEKDSLIASLNSSIEQSREYLSNTKSTLKNLRIFLSKFNSNIPEFSDEIDETCLFTVLNENLAILETAFTEIVAQKNSEIENIQASKNSLQELNVALEKKLSELEVKATTLENDNQILKDDLTQKIKALTRERDSINNELVTRNKEIHHCERTLNVYKERIENIRQNLSTKEKNISYLADKEMAKEQDKENIINQLDQDLKDIEAKVLNILTDREKLQQNIAQQGVPRNRELQNIFELCSKIMTALNIEIETENVEIYDSILCALDKVVKNATECNSSASENKQRMNDMLQIIDSLSQQKDETLDNLTQISKSNQALTSQLEEIQEENKVLNCDLQKGNEIIASLKKELSDKANDLENMVIKTQELKEHFVGLDSIMKEQIKDLQADNIQLTSRCSELELDVKKSRVIEIENLDYDEGFNDNINPRKSMGNSVQTTENIGPPSLLTICCNKIIETIQPSEESVSPSDSNTSIEYHHKETQYVSCECHTLLPELKSAQMENIRLTKLVEQLESLNEHLIKEHEEVRREIHLLAEPAFELQKKIASHKTNLSTLTATTYAENKSLRSQVKVLQHHHSRFHNVCQRDLPVVKKQLNALMSILKSDSLYSLNASFKRYSLPIILDNSTVHNVKNESTLDGDLLMLDTNVTLTTSADNTLMGLDQTCFDLTQPYTSNDIGCQTSDPSHEDNSDQYQLDLLINKNLEITHKLQCLEVENHNLKQEINDYALLKSSVKDTQSIPIKTKDECEKCEDLKEKKQLLEEELKLLSQKLKDVETQRSDIEKKYNNLSLEIPSIDALVKKLSIFEKELNGKSQEISKLKNLLTNKQEELKHLQQENDDLSNQVMENISETDDLNKELEKIKAESAKLAEKCNELEKALHETKEDKTNVLCSQCQIKDDIINSIQNVDVHSKLNRSLSDSDTSSRYNKICTLQNELHAGREDCKELTEEVATIKNQLDRSNLSMGQNMDLDDSMGESNIFTITKHFDSVDTQLNKFALPNIAQDRQPDIYSNEKLDCISFYVEKTGADKENLDCNIKIIDVMKMFYNNFVMKNTNEVENLVNKIKCYEESKNQLESHVNELSTEYSKVMSQLKDKESNTQRVNDTLSQIRQNICTIHEEILNLSNSNKNNKLISVFKDKLLNILDSNFGLSSVNVFEMVIDSLVSKHQKDLANIMDQYTKLQEHMESVSTELISVNNNLLQMKGQLTDKEKEFNLLKAQKERIHEISNAVTLDLVRKEQEICQTIVRGCKKLAEFNVLSSADFDKTLPLHENINMLFNCLLTELKCQSDILNEKEQLSLEIKTSKTELEENHKRLDSLQNENDQLKAELEHAISNQEESDLKYQSLSEENRSYLSIIQSTKQEVETLKQTLLEKEATLLKITHEKENTIKQSDRETEITKLYAEITRYKQEIEDLKAVNEMIVKEKESSATELEKSRELLKTNNLELDRMTSDILVLRESVKENMAVIDSLKLEAKSLLQQNIQLKEKFEEKCRDCSRLEINIKTHEKTAEIQSKMIMRLQRQKEEDDKVLAENTKRYEELNQRYSDLHKDCEIMKNNIKTSREEFDALKSAKQALEMRLSCIESDFEMGPKHRVSIDPTSESVRTRRQSIHDSKRMFSEKDFIGDHNKMEAVFESRAKPADLFMDVDDDDSNRSSPRRSSKGRDSILSSKHDQSEEPVSRPSSVAETRRRRQSIHDMHRSVRETPSPLGRPSSRLNESSNMKSTDLENNFVPSEVAELREQLSSCRQELEELREQYRELDEECDTCAQYLRERDEQCARLKKEKTALEGVVTELKNKLQSVNPNRSQQEPKTTFCHASVNTDEDWSNLHSVVVDRMSFDAEVEKNKRLTKTIEDLRFKKQELKVTLAKMQKALEKNANRDHSKELEHAKSELRACKLELSELKERYAELDEECETCSQYLREREEQCRKLKDAKAALEAKLQEYMDESCGVSSLREKRRSAHDRRRAAAPAPAPAPAVDAATQVADDFLSNQVERDSNSQKLIDDKTKEIKHLKMAIERLSQQKAALEQQLSAPAAPVYVATGSAIVQTQQLSDVMKENQKLKKINTKLIDICKKRGKKPDFITED